jgi:hypothetical protein
MVQSLLLHQDCGFQLNLVLEFCGKEYEFCVCVCERERERERERENRFGADFVKGKRFACEM